MRAYCVPEVIETGVPKDAVKRTVEPLAKEVPVIVAVARSAPVGRPAEVARSESVRFGGVPPQPLQKSWTSAFTRRPLTPAMKV